MVPALGRCPDEAWAEGIAKAPAGMLDSADDIDSLFSVLCVGRLDHRVVLLNAIWYSSDELRDVRMAYGARPMRVRCKLNEDDVTALRTEHPPGQGALDASAGEEAVLPAWHQQPYSRTRP